MEWRERGKGEKMVKERHRVGGKIKRERRRTAHFTLPDFTVPFYLPVLS